MNCYLLRIEGSFDRKSVENVEGFITTRFAISQSIDDAKDQADEKVIRELIDISPNLAESLIGLDLIEYEILPEKEFQLVKGFTFF